MAQVGENAGPFALEPQFRAQPRGQRFEQPAGELLEVGG
jgi:hypothetical protein